jgi:DNA-directed RNA polymerase specialized sigma24 family protein
MTARKESGDNTSDLVEGLSEDLKKRLDAVISFLALMAPEEMTQADKIVLLANHGFTPTEIAVILRTTSNTVNVALSRSRKGKKKVEEPVGESSQNQNPQMAQEPDGGIRKDSPDGK